MIRDLDRLVTASSRPRMPARVPPPEGGGRGGAALAFGPHGAVSANQERGQLKDVNGDGFVDLLTHYRTEETGIALGDTEACVTGETIHDSFEGCEETRTVPVGRPQLRAGRRAAR